ncbi:hypothetical protein PPERSA_04723 [Pseudocohnilembus persalinus]|uniref:Uncharacterized protein n=1 Tax=Pseudocohnilembus persalinus TaxID=266149 RepID=A0A0V0R4L0_PSEPJ|nr:hypothetical protein PPERSA_04723 [Pseudocohnilembus persalinus]|eukprot:KRX09417.1 hypothetical protein PPERSA_04723 [Pseudocohnilembus persalinus]
MSERQVLSNEKINQEPEKSNNFQDKINEYKVKQQKYLSEKNQLKQDLIQLEQMKIKLGELFQEKQNQNLPMQSTDFDIVDFQEELKYYKVIKSEAINFFYKVYKKEVEPGKTIKTILISVPGIKMVESVKTRMISDNNRQLRIMCVSIKYKEGQSEKLLKEISVDQNDEEQDYFNNQKLQFQDVKIDIPICNIAESFMKGGEYDSLRAKPLDEFSLYKINLEIVKDEDFSDFD